ncbi:MAG: DUF2723 domain-containing protein [Nitrospirota bacterium]
MIPVAIFLFTFLVYLWNLSSNLYWWDSGEFAFYSAFLGISHPTGYPLYMQILKMFSLLPLGSHPFLVNFVSALGASITVLLLYNICIKLTENRIASVSASLVLSFSPIFWSKAEVAEVYTIQTAIILSVVYIAIRWSEDRRQNTPSLTLPPRWGGQGWGGDSELRTPNDERSTDTRLLLLCSFVIGLGVTHHMSSVLLIPAFLCYIYLVDRKRIINLKKIFLIVAFFIAGFTPYIYIWIRSFLDAPFNYARFYSVDLATISGMYWLLSGKLFRYEMLSVGFSGLLSSAGFFVNSLIVEFLYIGAILGITGLVYIYKRSRQIFLLLTLVFLALSGFVIVYKVADIHDFFIMPFSIWGIWVAVGIDAVSKMLNRLRDRWRRGLRYIYISGIIFFAFFHLVNNFSDMDFNRESYADGYVRDVLESVEPNSLLFVTPTSTFAFLYSRYISGIRPDVEFLDYSGAYIRERNYLATRMEPNSELFIHLLYRDFKERMNNILTDSIKWRPVYISRNEDFLNDRFFKEGVSEGLIRLYEKQPPAIVNKITSDAIRTDIVFNDNLRLYGFWVPLELREGGIFRVRFYWQPIQRIDREYVIILFFSGGNTDKLENSSVSFYIGCTMGYGIYSPKGWKIGKVIEEDYDLWVKPYIRSGRYNLYVGVFDVEEYYSTPPSQRRLRLHRVGEVNISEGKGIKHPWD